MSEITRRQLLTFFGAAAAAAAAGPPLERLVTGGGMVEAAWPGDFTPVRMAHPLPIYTDRPSFLATGIGTGLTLPAAADPALLDFTVIDDVVVPPEFERYVIVRWGERIFPDADQYVGYNCDFTAFFPGKSGEGMLWVNHEYVSFPFSFLAPGTPANLTGAATTFQAVIGFPSPSTKDRQTLGEMLYNCGGSLMRLRLVKDHWTVVAADAANRRIHGLSGLAINGDRTDAYRTVSSWGTLAHQRGDRAHLVGTGPAASDVFPLSADGLGNRVIGTALNGHDAGKLLPFAYGPVRCEMTGPTFVGDQLIVSVQHPSEDVPIGDGVNLSRAIEMLRLDGTVFTQHRVVPRGSNWPANFLGDASKLPRPTTIAIRRKR